MKDDMIRLTGLWKNKDKNGNTYLSGNLTGITFLMVMPNNLQEEGLRARLHSISKSLGEEAEQASKGEEL
jgi:hypothetical protein